MVDPVSGTSARSGYEYEPENELGRRSGDRPGRQPDQHVEAHEDHGGSRPAWTGVAIMMAAAVVAGLAVVGGDWWVFGVSVVGGLAIGLLVWRLMADAKRKQADARAGSDLPAGERTERQIAGDREGRQHDDAGQRHGATRADARPRE